MCSKVLLNFHHPRAKLDLSIAVTCFINSPTVYQHILQIVMKCYVCCYKCLHAQFKLVKAKYTLIKFGFFINIIDNVTRGAISCVKCLLTIIIEENELKRHSNNPNDQ